MRRIRLFALVLAVAGVTAAPAAAAPAPAPYGAHDARGFRNILPPGQSGFDNALQLAQFETQGTRPPHNNDQLGMYGNLVYVAPNLKAADIPKYFKDATFGVKAGDVARKYSPRGDVTIVRDKGFGVPHVYGATRAGAMFGLGYAAAEDRLFFIDVLRHLGRAQLTSFAGGAPGNQAFDASEWAIAPYTEADLQKQIDQLPKLYGAAGQTVVNDANNYVAGINQYIQEAKVNPTKMPGEYAAINKPQGPDPWNTRDIIATAALVGGIFGAGGGLEPQSAEVLQGLQKRLGKRAGRRSWADFRSANDPEAPTTVRGKSFTYQKPPKKLAKGSLAMPDTGTLRYQPVNGAGSGGSGPKSATATAAAKPDPCPPHGLVCLPGSMSNALVVSARESRSGHPVAVFGPQTGYFAPQILMEEDVHAPGIDARGAAFPGVNQYVQLGRGRDYAWSATSAGEDLTDTFAVPLCKPGGGTPPANADHYRFHGKCLAMELLSRDNSWVPNAADQTPPGSEHLRAQRTALGLVVARGKVRGRPVAFTSLRSTYMHEVDSARGFIDFNDPSKMRTPVAFQHAANKIGYAFNWLYVNAKHDAYFNSGALPVRGKRTSTNFPVWGGDRRFEWQGWNPVRRTSKLQPFARHANTIDQRYLTSWNNKQAPGYRTSDSKWSYSPVFRSQSLDDRVRAGIRGSSKMSLVGLINAMEDAGTVDLRGTRDLPLALRVLGKQSKHPKLARAIKTLRSWVRAGAHRRDRDHNHRYEHSEAVLILDAWFPRWVDAEFKPTIGGDVFDRIDAINEVDNAPNNHGDHLGSAYDDGWYGYINKDLRQVLGKRVRGRYSRTYCGGGKLKACRALLARTLTGALKLSRARVYSGDSACEDGDQWCWDAVRQRPLGAITQPLIHWINRPTFQQAVEIQGSAP
ncbi:MAG: penicillin acylase family protein [Thermoleophilaceae bacterium]